MAKYLIDSTDIEIEEVSGTENLKFNLASGNSVEQMIGDLSNLSTTSKSNLVNAVNEVNTNLTNLNTYSTTEKSIGTWINGKTIYRKVINIGNLPNSGVKNISLGVANIDEIINMYGTVSDGEFTLPLPYFMPNELITTYGIGIESPTKASINIVTGTDRTDYSGYAVIEYTKN